MPIGGQFTSSERQEADVQIQAPQHAVAAVLAQFENLPSTPAECFDTCKQTSCDVRVALRAQGHDARWVQLAGASTEMASRLPDDSRWRDLSPDRWAHYETEADGRVIDFTFRQCDPDADFPTTLDPDPWERR